MHQLQNKWILWEHQNTNLSYDQNTSKLGEFNTIEHFWNHYNNYPPPSKIFYNNGSKPKLIYPTREISSLSLFKEGILPKWEDSQNKDGGDFAIRKFENLDELDRLWEELSVLCIGEQLDQMVNGIRVVDSSIPNKKILYRIEIWFNDKNHKDELETNIKTKLNIPNKELFYKEHSTAVETTPRKGKYTRNRRNYLGSDRNFNDRFKGRFNS